MLLRWMVIVLVAASLSSCATQTRKVSNAKMPMDPANVTFTGYKIWDTPPRLISGNQPIYPISQALSARVGITEIAFTIGTDGKTRHFEVLRADNKVFSNHAILAVEEWRFEPATKDGAAIEARVKYGFHFGFD